ncbi:hypothetical protein SLNWT_3091 [Streptomyces albus]|uniref:Lipopolysaccharide biosynthesis protein n=1 Tax=Streptomyces albus (strain ATCC 21838 / DSM 41398 / FERM P-419 / JCM 4703 / NBRC 107858) TaxID=1081613 RepID=A0A0B5EZI4_STRA4|nr:hypothetical protein SLNWT_3091 [Streptomyces albus]AOU77776.1 hypothetical protein SLNHY_3085 [Streptomyces albus]AYN33537.1 lipopolysaccharide biosynthesis protein [Streptomyces albus]
MTEQSPPRPAAARAALRTFAARLRRLPAWWLLPVCALLGAVIGGAYGLLRAPQYTATSYVIAVPGDKADPATALGFAQAYGRVATQLAVLGDAQVEAGVPVATLRESVRAATSPDAPMISLSATAASPGTATDMANAVARALTANARLTKDAMRVQLVQFSRATEPSSPASASAAVTALVGASAGGLLGGLALLARPRRRTAGGENASVPAPAGESAPAAERAAAGEARAAT